jgi:hypothetical protein
MVTTNFPYGGSQRDLVLHDGNIIAVGDVTDDSSQNTFVIVKYNENGTLDANFDDGGIVVTPPLYYPILIVLRGWSESKQTEKHYQVVPFIL